MKLLWLQAAGCGGCTQSMLGAERKAWFVALAALSKSATPKRVRENSRSDHPLIAPAIRKSGPK